MDVFQIIGNIVGIQIIGNIIGIPDDQIRLLVALLLCVPIGFLFQKVKGRTTRVNVGTTIGLALTYLVYNEGIITVIIQSIIVYVMVKKLGRKCAMPVFIETLLYDGFLSFYQQQLNRRIDITTVLMMNTCKWTSFAWCVSDGFKDDSDLSDDQKIRKIKTLPSFIDYFGYMFFFCGCIAGPANDYYEYDEFMDLKGIYSKPPPQSTIIQETLRLIRNGVITSLILVFLGKSYPIEFCISKEFAESNFLYKMIWVNLSITILRTKYISGWSFSEAGFASSGLSYNGYQNNVHQFSRIKSVDISFEFDHNIQNKVKLWNVSVQSWLGRYVYQRVYSSKEMKGNAIKQNKAQLITYMVSAFWHGFYISYYLSFLQWAIMNTTAKYFYRASLNTNTFKIFDTNIFAKIIRFIAISTVFNVFGLGFQLLSFQKNITLYNQIWWSLNLINVLVYVIFSVTQFGQKSRKDKQQ